MPDTPARPARRTVLAAAAAAAGAGALAAAAGPTLLGAAPAAAGVTLWSRPGSAGAPPVEGLHLTYGADPAREMTVSWTSAGRVQNPRAVLGTAAQGYGSGVSARTRHYTDRVTGREVYVHHAGLTGLRPDHDYIYAAVHDGAEPDAGTFRTPPAGRAPFVFTSFGDQGTPDIGNTLGSPAAADIVAGIERVGPTFHLLNGDLCYANLDTDPVRTWTNFHANNSRSARFRPWMPVAGNHENEKGIEFASYQNRFELPGGATGADRGLWYAFTVGGVRVVCLQNDDVALQDGGSSYVNGYSHGAQRAWLEKELAASRSSRDIDWIVVCMHQVVISTADFNGADLGVRAAWGPLFDRYGVDLVVCGHEHNYERSHPVRGHQANDTQTPIPVATRTDRVDTSAGTVHMVLGGGGTSSPSNQLFYDQLQSKVITAVAAPDPTTGKRAPVYVMEDAPYSALRDRGHSYGFAAFAVDPGSPGGRTSMTVTYYDVTGVSGTLTPYDRFTLTRPRSDGS